MEFAILFILAFLIGLIAYMVSNQWMLSVGSALVLFFLNILSDTDAQSSWGFSLIFGVPIVFVGSLLGPYIVELRRGGIDDLDGSELSEDDSLSADGSQSAEGSQPAEGSKLADADGSQEK